MLSKCSAEAEHFSYIKIAFTFHGGYDIINDIIDICLGERLPNLIYFALALVLGFVAYGLSIFFYIKAQGIIGAAKTSAYYAVAPFIGTLLSFFIFKELPTAAYFIGLAIMILGTVIVVIDTLAQRHSHTHKHLLQSEDGSMIELEHSHEHSHKVIEPISTNIK